MVLGPHQRDGCRLAEYPGPKRPVLLCRVLFNFFFFLQHHVAQQLRALGHQHFLPRTHIDEASQFLTFRGEELLAVSPLQHLLAATRGA